MKTFDYLMPDTLNEAVQLSRQRGTRIKAGGTDLLGLLKEGVESPEKLVGLGQVPDLTGIVKRPGGGFSIGAMTTVSDIADHKELGHVYPVLTMAAKSVASPQLRNMGTVGGNICQRPRCWYFRGDFDCLRKGGDTCFAFDGENRFHCVVGGDSCFIVHPSDLAVALTALSATVLVRNTTSQLSVPMDQFFVLPEQDVTRETILEPGDIVTAIQVPGPPPGRRSVYLKTADRTVFDFATVQCRGPGRCQERHRPQRPCCAGWGGADSLG